jgi:hypothetical protein
MSSSQTNDTNKPIIQKSNESKTFYDTTLNINPLTLVLAFFLFTISSFGGTIRKQMLTNDLIELISKNPIVRHVLLYIILFFTISITLKNDNIRLVNAFINSTILYIAFIIFSRSELIEQFITFTLLLIGYIINKFNYYRKNVNKIEDETNKKIILARQIIFSLAAVTMIIGFIRYIINNRNQNILQLIFGRFS